MPRIRRKPNLHLRKIVLEETNEGRDIIRFLKNVIVHIEDGPKTFGIRPQDFARNHKIASARILAKLGFEEGKRYLRRTYVPTPFRRTHPEEEDVPRPDMTRDTADLYRLVRKETKDGADIMLYFIRITKGLHPEYKPHLRMAAAKELVRQIEYDYEEEPTGSPEPTPPTPTRAEPATSDGSTSPAPTDSTPATDPVGASLVGAHAPQPEPTTSPESNSNPEPTNPVHPEHPINPDSDNTNSNPEPTNPVNPASDKITAHPPNPTNHSSDNQPNPVNPASDKITVNHPNPTNHSSDNTPISFRDFQRQLYIQDGSAPYRDYAAQYARKENESIFQSIIRRASNRRDPEEAKSVAEELITRFDQFMEERDPNYRPEEVPRELIVKSLKERMDESKPYLFNPADYYDLDWDYFYYCLCRNCAQCDERDYYFQFMSELAEEYEDP